MYALPNMRVEGTCYYKKCLLVIDSIHTVHTAQYPKTKNQQEITRMKALTFLVGAFHVIGRELFASQLICGGDHCNKTRQMRICVCVFSSTFMLRSGWIFF